MKFRMLFKRKVAELVLCMKNLTSFDFGGRVRTLIKDFPGLLALIGGTLMFIGIFLPNVYVYYDNFIVTQCVFSNQFQLGGWYVFLLTTILLGLAYLRQTFWAAATSAMCLAVTLLQGIFVPFSSRSSYGIGEVYSGVHIGWFMLLIGELAVIGAFALEEFVFKKHSAPANAGEPVANATVVDTD